MAKKAIKSNPVEKAIRRLGDVRSTATACGVTTQTVYLWLKAGYLTNLRLAFLLADAADMNARELMGE
jgi:hypothetical protein